MTANSGAVKGSASLTVVPALVSIVVTPGNPSIAPGTTEQFTATGTYSDNSTQNVTNQATWVSTSPMVAAIGTAGPMRAVARGLVARADLEAAPSRDIRVDEVRALSRSLALAAVRGRRKIAVLVPAEALNERAQNTLLKTLEEPPPATTFLLVTEQPDALLATVRSRCARVQLAPLPDRVVADLLVARGAPVDEARRRAARAEGSIGRALAMDAQELDRRRELVEAVEEAVAAPDERGALDLAESAAERDAAARILGRGNGHRGLSESDLRRRHRRSRDEPGQGARAAGAGAYRPRPARRQHPGVPA